VTADKANNVLKLVGIGLAGIGLIGIVSNYTIVRIKSKSKEGKIR
jgi:hypothetical protein